LKIFEGPKDLDIKLREGHRLLRILLKAHYLIDNQAPNVAAEVFHNKEISEKISVAYNYTKSLFILNRESDPDGVKFINSYALRERELKLKH
jgi:hypothetical protein